MMTMIQEDLEVVRHITILHDEDIKRIPRTMTISTGEVDMEETELPYIEMLIQEALGSITPDAIATRIVLILCTKDHRRLIRRTRCPE